MSEAQQIRATVQIPGKENAQPLQRLLTLETVCEWIRYQGFDDYTTDGLIELAKKYPTQALPSFRRNFNLMIQRVRQQRQRDNRKLEEMSGQEEISQAKEDSRETCDGNCGEHCCGGDPNKPCCKHETGVSYNEHAEQTPDAY